MDQAGVINFNGGVKTANLFPDLDEAQLQMIDDAAKDGFTEDELQQLDNSGIDADTIKNNASKSGGAKAASSKTNADVQSRAAEIMAKYSSSDADPQTQIMNFGKALDDGIVQQLADEGFDKMQVVDVISGAFPNIGIYSNGDGTYDCPRGHEFASIYDKFVSQMANLDNAELKAAKQQLASLNYDILNNNRKLKNLEYNITTLQEKIEEQINDAIEESEEITAEQKENAKILVSKHLNEYTNSNGEMTYSEFTRGLTSDLDSLAGQSNSKLSATVQKMMDAQSDMSTLNGYLTTMGDVIDTNAKLSEQANDVQAQIADLKQQAATAEGAEDQCCKRTDPIGFSDGEKRYDFFVDEDNDGNVTNENEFLGAKNGFKEMTDADADGDGKVTAAELDSKNVKVVVTNTDGTQEIKNASEVLGENDSIDLTSYQAQNTEMSNGNTLQGTFNVNMNGKTLDGYQTLDSLDWLDDNYDFSDEIAGRGRFAQEQTEAVAAENYDEKYNIFMNKYSQLEDLEVRALETLGVDTQKVQTGISQMSASEGAQKAEVIEEAFKIKAQKADDQAKKEEKAEAEKEAKAEAEAEAKAEAEAEAEAEEEKEKEKEKENELEEE